MFSEIILVPSEIEAESIKNLNLNLHIIGIGPVEATLSTYQILSQRKKEVVFLTGWAGAYPETGLSPGDIVVATYEIFADFGKKYENYYEDFPQDLKTFSNVISLDNFYTQKTIHILKNHGFKPHAGILATVCSATYEPKKIIFFRKKYNAIAENMEGFGVARACEKMNTLLVEIRVISNLLAQKEENWDKEKASAVLKKVWECIIKNWK